MPRRTEVRDSAQAGLFEQGQPAATLDAQSRRQLVALVEALMIEIAEALAIEEAGNEQDHG